MINAKILDDSCIQFVSSKMIGKMILPHGTTEQDEIDFYINTNHTNYFIESERGFLCVAEHESFVFIHFAWYDGSFTAHKEMVELGKQLYRHYTLCHKKRMYYTGLKNFYKSNSEEVMENIWVFKPKNI